jgi:hypothetical protein
MRRQGQIGNRTTRKFGSEHKGYIIQRWVRDGIAIWEYIDLG